MSKKNKVARKLKSLDSMTEIVPFIMVNRSGAQIFFRDTLEIEKVEKFIREKQQQGMVNLSVLHVLIAAYVHTVAQRPAINRFIQVQRIWTRNNIEISLTIKQEMLLNSPDTVIKLTLPKTATLTDVYNALNAEILSYRANPGNNVDDTAKAFTRLPGVILKFAVHFVKTLDYLGLVPRSLKKISPFHSSIYVTAIGSLGIQTVYHHLYDFGCCPVFMAFGARHNVYIPDSDGNIKKRKCIDISFTLDERICDGYYYADAFKYMKRLLRNPSRLDEIPEVVEDVK